MRPALLLLLVACGGAAKDEPATTPSTPAPQPTTPAPTTPTTDSATPPAPTTDSATTPAPTGGTGTSATTGDTGTSPAPTGDGTLRLATWNVAELDVEGQGDNPRTADDLALLADYAVRLEADVVALQEVRGVTGTQLLFPATEWAAECEDRTSGQNVCVVLRTDSGWTMTRNPDVVDLNASDPNLRQGLDLTLEQPGRLPLRILAVHLKYGCLSGTSAADCGVLFDQFDIVEDWIDARTTAGEAYAVLGDFNRFLTATDSVWLDLDDNDPVGADLTRSIPQGTPAPCWDGFFPELIDHIVLDPSSASWMRASDQLIYDETDFYTWYERLSDHCPLWADFDVPEAP